MGESFTFVGSLLHVETAEALYEYHGAHKTQHLVREPLEIDALMCRHASLNGPKCWNLSRKRLHGTPRALIPVSPGKWYLVGNVVYTLPLFFSLHSGRSTFVERVSRCRLERCRDTTFSNSLFHFILLSALQLLYFYRSFFLTFP